MFPKIKYINKSKKDFIKYYMFLYIKYQTYFLKNMIKILS